MKNTLDQFYTNEAVALKYYNILKQKVEINSYDICLEPSAGQGAFYKLLPTQMRAAGQAVITHCLHPPPNNTQCRLRILHHGKTKLA